ncbi:hypothetical protein V6N13_001666 [Hibiscus sabdariffa]
MGSSSAHVERWKEGIESRVAAELGWVVGAAIGLDWCSAEAGGSAVAKSIGMLTGITSMIFIHRMYFFLVQPVRMGVPV